MPCGCSPGTTGARDGGGKVRSVAEAKLWLIRDFDEGAHWDRAVVWAPTAEEARSVLAAKIGTDEDGYPETVWSPLPADEWRVEEAAAWGVVFLLGAGCRG